MSADGQHTKWCRNTAENFARLSRAHERYRHTDDRQTDGRPMTYSEREREFTFSKKSLRTAASVRQICRQDTPEAHIIIHRSERITAFHFHGGRVRLRMLALMSAVTG